MYQPKRHVLHPGIVIVIGALLVAACVPTSPPMRFFVLTPIEASEPPRLVLDDRTVLLGPLQMAAYLDRPQLMTRRPDGELMLHELDRWAAPLDEMFVQTLADNLMRLTGSEQVLPYPTPGRADADLRVTGQILRFDTDTDSVAVLRVRWQVKNRSGDVIIPPRLAEYRTRASTDDATMRVAALSAALAEFSQDLAAGLADEAATR